MAFTSMFVINKCKPGRSGTERHGSTNVYSGTVSAHSRQIQVEVIDHETKEHDVKPATSVESDTAD